jgi:chromosome segregation ATPase
LTNSYFVDQDDSPSELLEFEPMLDSKHPECELTTPLANGSDPQLSVDAQSNTTMSVITQSSMIPATETTFDLTAELDSLLESLRLVTPHPPDLAITAASNPKSGNLVAIAANESINYPQLRQDLITVSEQISTARAQLQSVHQRNQAQVDAVDASVLQVNKIKVRIKQLARYNKYQVEKIQDTIGIIDRIRTEIATGLEEFGGYAEVAAMLTELKTIRAESIAAQERLKDGQESFYESLRAIQAQVVTQNHESVEKLRQYHELIQDLSQTTSADRLQIAGMSADLNVNLNQVQDLNLQIVEMHAQVTDKSHALQLQMAEINRGFTELSQSLHQDKEQFYELTAETIDRTDALRLQFADMSNQISGDRETIAYLQAELESVSQTADRETEQQLDYFDLQLQELIDKYEHQQKIQSSKSRKFSSWLWGLSIAVGVISVLLIRIALSLN